MGAARQKYKMEMIDNIHVFYRRTGKLCYYRELEWLGFYLDNVSGYFDHRYEDALLDFCEKNPGSIEFPNLLVDIFGVFGVIGADPFSIARVTEMARWYDHLIFLSRAGLTIPLESGGVPLAHSSLFNNAKDSTMKDVIGSRQSCFFCGLHRWFCRLCRTRFCSSH